MGHSESSDSAAASPESDVALRETVERSLDGLWSVVNELSRICPTDDRYRVSVFGSARVQPGEPLYAEVRDLAAALAAEGCDIVTGGGPGLMQAANEGENRGDPNNETRSIGVGIEVPFEDGLNPFVEKAYTHRTFYTRLHQFVRLSNAFVVVGGGIGTTLESMMIWQLLQVRHIEGVPLIMVGPMWRELVEWGKKTMLTAPRPFASADDFDIPLCVDTVEEAVAAVLAAKRDWSAKRVTKD